jgi:hypothetical protein
VGWLFALLGLGFLALTVLAVLGTGEHYLVDLVVALPFATAIGASAARRSRLAILGFTITVVSLVLIALLGR